VIQITPSCDQEHTLQGMNTLSSVWTKMYFHMGKARKQAVTSLATIVVCCACSFALDPSLDVSQYAHTTWKVRDGFTKGVLTALAQTPDGYLWIGTESGLYRFDAVRRGLWQPPPGQQLPGTLITDLLTARDGTLWIATFTGLASWKDGKLTQVPELDGQRVVALLEAHDGSIWISTYPVSGGSVCDIRNRVVHCEKLPAGSESLYEDKMGRLWVGLSNGIWRWKPGTPEFFPIPVDDYGVTSFAEDEQGHLLFGSHAGIRRLIDGRIESFPSSASSFHWPVTRMFRDHNGGLWVATSQNGVIHIHEQGRTDVFSHLDGLSGDYVTRFLEDREGNIWVSTYDGLDRFREYAVPTVSNKQGLSNTVAWSVLAAKDGGVWIATNGGLEYWKNGEITVFGSGVRTHKKSDGKLDGSPPISLFEDSSVRIWVSTSRELGYLQENGFTPIREVPTGIVFSVTEVSSGHIWASSKQAGLLHIFQGHLLQHISWADLGSKGFATVLISDPSHNGLWLGFSQGGVAHYLDGAIRASYSASNGLGKGRVANLHFGSGGALWAATETGLSRIENGNVTTLTTKNGLPCDHVVGSIEDSDQSMWLYMDCGLVRIVKTELDAWVADPTRVLKTEFFDTSDGVRGHASSGGFSPLMTKSADGKIWFLPWDGVSVIDPHHLPFNKILPPVHIEKVTADDKSVDISNSVRLPTGVRHLDIDYTALSLVVPEKVRFRVKLEGEDKDWRELVNVRHVEYTNLPPKHYRFRVLACNNSGVWNEEGAALDFVIPPAWYQTNWFRGACIAAFLMMIWGIHELRVRQLAAQFNMRLEERVSERTRIARDLHDTLLQSFQGLVFRFQAVRNQLPNRPEKACEVLDSALISADQAIAGRS
jgi:ligand-binding sensor domain-containing protein